MAFYMVHFMVLGLGTSLCALEEIGKGTDIRNANGKIHLRSSFTHYLRNS